eukprot:TRINITY_DN2307_c0_g1_i5.p1 TRINITY_DN2307_c0_g1~~TRINITY_DN2307_c0_g1_i5.p1  ORF type:complete len:370 (-),score=41.84 TRINITY_DN2307_c0_g1_i5:264-1373(-)
MAVAAAGEFSSVVAQDYNRAKEVKDFDDSKSGVKGLVDAGVAKIPRIFIRRPEDLHDEKSDSDLTHLEIPVVDLGDVEEDVVRRKEIVTGIRQAAETWGFFQVVNHGVPISVFDEMIEGVKKFFEQPNDVKMEYYSRDPTRKVKYTSNFYLYTSPAADWRDTLSFRLAPDPLDPQELPAVCREISVEFSKHVMGLGNTLFQFLSEALRLHPNQLKDMECTKGASFVCHYYPACPEPELTIGASKHADPDFLTILLQDQIGGLQVLHQHQWVDVPYIPGALVVNIGDLLQLISNDKFKSVEHRVLANLVSPRVSVACFFASYLPPSLKLYGPIKELLSDDNPPLYKEITMTEFIEQSYSDEPSFLTYFKL